MCSPTPPPQSDLRFCEEHQSLRLPEDLKGRTCLRATGPKDLCPFCLVQVGELWLGHTEGNLLESGTRVTWKGGHQSELFNPRQERTRALA